MTWTLIIACAAGIKCGLVRPMILVRQYPTREICLWSGEMMLNYVPVDRFVIRCRRDKQK